MKRRIALITIVTAAISLPMLPGCKTAGTYDPVKTEKLESIITPFVSKGIRLVIANNQPIKADLGDYFRAFGSVFKSMVDTGKFSPTYLLTAANAATEKFQGKMPDYAVDIKEGTVALYNLFYNGSADAQLDPAKAPVHVANVIQKAIDQALKDSGLPGL
jgi:hypothetical protein